ncbi:MAG: thioredoxin family protein [Erysipelotrichaceae bacterium]
MKNKLNIIIALIGCLLLINIIQLSKGYSNKNNSEESTKRDETQYLEKSDYYQSHVITDKNIDLSKISKGSYLVYFYQNGCGYCEEANYYLNSFIEFKLTEKIDIYFVNLSSTKINVEVKSTPTIFLYENGEKTVINGSDKVFELLDGFAKNKS